MLQKIQQHQRQKKFNHFDPNSFLNPQVSKGFILAAMEDGVIIVGHDRFSIDVLTPKELATIAWMLVVLNCTPAGSA